MEIDIETRLPAAQQEEALRTQLDNVAEEFLKLEKYVNLNCTGILNQSRADFLQFFTNIIMKIRFPQNPEKTRSTAAESVQGFLCV